MLWPVTSSIPALPIRQRLGKSAWGVPAPFGPDGWSYLHRSGNGKVILTAAPGPGEPDGAEDWWHASISYADRLPGYEDLTLLHAAVWPAGYAYQVFAPPSQHVNIHQFALHLWGKADGRALLPEFGVYGTI
jgi:hypothetical protein